MPKRPFAAHLLRPLLLAIGLNSAPAAADLSASAPPLTENQAGRPSVKSTDFDDSVAGIDRNGDGIRDDIEIYIDRTYPDPRQNRAMKQFARSEQQFLVEAGSETQAVHNTYAIFKSLDCLGKVFGRAGSTHAKDVEAMILNTEHRFAAYGLAMEKSSGHTYSAEKGKPCE